MTELERDLGLCLLEGLCRRGLISRDLWGECCRLWQRRPVSAPEPEKAPQGLGTP